MSDPVTVIVGHRLGKVEAVRRLKEGFARTKGQLGQMVAIEQETREGPAFVVAVTLTVPFQSPG